MYLFHYPLLCEDQYVFKIAKDNLYYSLFIISRQRLKRRLTKTYLVMTLHVRVATIPIIDWKKEKKKVNQSASFFVV